MVDVRIILSGGWVALMLTYLLGDVMRIFAGDMTPGEMDGVEASQGTFLGAAAFMLIPIVMVVLSLTSADVTRSGSWWAHAATYGPPNE